jgi:hypothetical protein
LEEKPTSVNRKPKAAEEEEGVPKEDAEVMPVGKPKRKRRRDRKLAAERRRHKLKDKTLEKCGSQKRLAVARRETSHRAKVVRQKENVVGRNHTRPMIEQATPRVGLLRKKSRTHHEGKRAACISLTCGRTI